MTQLPDSNSRAFAPMDQGEAWLGLFQKGASAWTAAYVEGAATLARINAAQTKSFLDMATLAATAWRPGSFMQASDEILRDELLFAEVQAEKLAEGVRTTLDRLSDGVDTLQPFPLPE